LLITALTLVPTLVMAAIAATAISEAMRVYSMAVAPRSFFQDAAKEGQHDFLLEMNVKKFRHTGRL